MIWGRLLKTVKAIDKAAESICDSMARAEMPEWKQKIKCPRNQACPVDSEDTARNCCARHSKRAQAITGEIK